MLLTYSYSYVCLVLFNSPLRRLLKSKRIDLFSCLYFHQYLNLQRSISSSETDTTSVNIGSDSASFERVQ